LLGQQVVYAKTSLWIGWLMGLLLTLGVVLGLFIYVNPHARFVSNRFPPVTTGARAIKTELYKHLNTAPNIIMLGSSRAFTLSPEYLKARTGYTAFNMSVESAIGGDYAIQLNYILAQDYPTQVLIIEFSQETLPESNYFNSDLQPISLISYIPFIPSTLVLNETIKEIFGVQATSDSIYLLTLPKVQNRLRTWEFDETGLAKRRPVNAREYQVLLKDRIIHRIEGLHCSPIINEKSKNAFEEFLKLTRETNIGIVLYVSPINSVLYDAAYKKSTEAFIRCRQTIHSYLRSLTSKYPNVFFRDLSDDKKINDLKENGFYDTVHLRPIAANMVIDALLPDIKSAIEWAKEKREQKSP